MVKVIAENGKFRVEGTFDLGYIGTFRGDQIKLLTSYNEIRDWKCMREIPRIKKLSDEKVAGFLTTYINMLECKVQNNIKQINDDLLWSMFFDMNDGGIEFWNCRELTVPELMPAAPTYENIYSAASEKAQEFLNNLPKEEKKKKYNQKKPDYEAFLRENLPMFNWDNLINSIRAEHLTLDGEHLTYQCSDGYGGVVLCCAYNELGEDLKSTDWHNF